VSGDFRAFANNPWPIAGADLEHRRKLPVPRRGALPPFLVKRGPDGRIVVENGLQVWLAPGSAFGDDDGIRRRRAVRGRAGAPEPPLSIVRKPGGALTVHARVMRGDGMNAWMEAFTIDSPHGERREVISRSYGEPAKGALLERAGVIHGATTSLTNEVHGRSVTSRGVDPECQAEKARGSL